MSDKREQSPIFFIQQMNVVTTDNVSDVTVNATEIGCLQLNQYEGDAREGLKATAASLLGKPATSKKLPSGGATNATEAGTIPLKKEPTKVSQSVWMFTDQELDPRSRVYRGRQEMVCGQWREVAVKLMPYNKSSIQEVKTLTRLEPHQNLVRIYEAGEYHNTFHWIYVIMEICSSNLHNYLKNNKLSTEKAASFFKQLIDGMAHMHKYNIAHRDIKPDNILISKCGNYLKLADFGVSKDIPDGQTDVSDTSPGAGADGYRPPEMYREGAKTGLSSDIFPLGIVSFYIFTNGRHPFGSNPYDWSYNIRRNQHLRLNLLPDFPEPYSHHRGRLLRLLETMLQTRPEDRPTIIAIQNHSYFKGDQLNRSRSSGSDLKKLAKRYKKKDWKRRQTTQITLRGITTEDSSEGARPGSSSSSTAFILFDKKSKCTYSVTIETNAMKRGPAFHQNMEGASFQAVSLDKDIFILMQDQSMLRLSWKTKSWHREESYSCHHGWRPACATSTDSLFLVGGSGLTLSKLVTKFDHAIKNWTRLRDMPVQKRDSAILVTRDHLVCFGGETERTPYSNDVLRMNVSSEEWNELSPMRYARAAASVVEYDGNYYLFGGFSNNRLLDSVEMYDLKSGNWTELAPMCRRRSSFRSFNVYDEIFCVGGDLAGHESLENECRTIERYDVRKNAWKMLPLQENLVIIDSVLLDMS